jgi:hypothetical protein
MMSICGMQCLGNIIIVPFWSKPLQGRSSLKNPIPSDEVAHGVEANRHWLAREQYAGQAHSAIAVSNSKQAKGHIAQWNS